MLLILLHFSLLKREPNQSEHVTAQVITIWHGSYKNSENKEFITTMSNEHHFIQCDLEMNRWSAGSRFIFILHMTTATRSLGALNLFQFFFFVESCFDHDLTYWGTFPFKILFLKKRNSYFTMQLQTKLLQPACISKAKQPLGRLPCTLKQRATSQDKMVCGGALRPQTKSYPLVEFP